MTTPIQKPGGDTLDISEQSQPGQYSDTTIPSKRDDDITEKRKDIKIDKNQDSGWRGWLDACKQVWPVYLATHCAFVILTYLASLFSIGNFSVVTLDIGTLVTSWDQWDTGHFKAIATHGYDIYWRTAFFPLYPLLERLLNYSMHNVLVAGLLISNVATLLTFVVLYRLVTQDFNRQIAARAVLYLAVFPTAFFLSAAYNESLFILLTLLSFYFMRQGQWWLAGATGFLAALTRSSGLLLLVPFVYEYLRQHNFQLKAIRINSVSVLFIPAGLGLFMLYCAHKFHDPFAFSHAQHRWQREFQMPWVTFQDVFTILQKQQFLSFESIHIVIDSAAWVFTFGLLILCIVGPWRFAKQLWVYALYGFTLSFFLIMFPSEHQPVQSLSRLVIEIFPAFILLATLGKKPGVNLYYLAIAGSMLCFMLLQFLTGHWIV
jgi:Gpi18-like mannosyltransferase